jgi:nucleoid-associated protein YgaU
MFGSRLDFEHTFVDHGPMHRTYVRRRVTALAVGVVLVLAVSGPMARAIGLVGHEPFLVSARTYVVRPGDSLWTIATTVAPERDPRRVVLELEQANAGSVDRLVPGQVLTVPGSD